MSGQYGLTKEEKDTIKKILDNNKIDYQDSEVSIHISGYNDYDKEEPFIEESIYVQVD